MERRVEDSIAELECRYGVTTDELLAWLPPNRCSGVPRSVIHRWLSLLDVLENARENAVAEG